VLACFDLGDAEIGIGARPRRHVGRALPDASLSVDDVLELRKLTALIEELRDLALRLAISTVVLRPARLSAYRHAVAHFVETREDASGCPREDREPLARLRGLLGPLEDLGADAIRAALSPRRRAPASATALILHKVRSCRSR
jgi:hypothetical protein